MTMNTYELRANLRDTDAEALLLKAATVEASLSVAEGESLLGDYQSAAHAATILRNLRLADPPKLSGSVRLTSFGVRVARDITESRRSGEDREFRVQLQILDWLDKQNPAPRDAMEFIECDSATVDGVRVSTEELLIQIESLVSLNLVAVKSTLQSRTLRPKILTDGKTALRLGSVYRYLAAQGSSQQVTNNDFSVNVEASGATGPINIAGGQSNSVTG